MSFWFGTRQVGRTKSLTNNCDNRTMLAMELPYGERDRTAPVDHYASILHSYAAPSSSVVEGSTIAARQRSGVWSAPFKDKTKKKDNIIGSRSTSPPQRGELDDAATITTQVFKAKLDQLSSFRQLSQDERQQLLLDVKKLLGGDADTTKKKSSNYDHRQRSTSGGNKTSTTDVYEDGSTMFSTDEESQTQFTFDETQFGGDQTQFTQFTLDETQFTVNEDQTEFTINEDLTQFTTSNEDDDQETQFSSTDSQSLLSLIDNVLIDNVFSYKSDSGYYNRSRRRERNASWSHGGSVDYDVEEHDPFGENCMLSMCDSFLSRLICDGKSSDTVDMAARERRKENHRSRAGSGSRKGSRERKHDTTDKHRRRVTVAY